MQLRRERLERCQRFVELGHADGQLTRGPSFQLPPLQFCRALRGHGRLGLAEVTVLGVRRRRLRLNQLHIMHHQGAVHGDGMQTLQRLGDPLNLRAVQSSVICDHPIERNDEISQLPLERSVIRSRRGEVQERNGRPQVARAANEPVVSNPGIRRHVRVVATQANDAIPAHRVSHSCSFQLRYDALSLLLSMHHPKALTFGMKGRYVQRSPPAQLFQTQRFGCVGLHELSGRRAVFTNVRQHHSLQTISGEGAAERALVSTHLVLVHDIGLRGLNDGGRSGAGAAGGGAGRGR